jgi:hypothetical protein
MFGAGLAFAASTVASEALTVSPQNGQLGTNPQQEPFGASGVAEWADYYYQDYFYVTLTGTGLQNLDITILSATNICTGCGYLEMSIGKLPPNGYGVTSPVNIFPIANFDYQVPAGDYIITFAGQLPSPTSTSSFEGTITAGSPLSETPLPSTWLMLLSGFVGLGFMAYRGTKKRTAALAAA